MAGRSMQHPGRSHVQVWACLDPTPHCPCRRGIPHEVVGQSRLVEEEDVLALVS